MTRLRICHTLGGLNEKLGGPSRTVPLLCDALVRSGRASVDLVSQTFDDEVERARHLVSDNVPVHFVGGRDSAFRGLLGFRRFTRRLDEVCRQSAIQILHDHGAWSGSNRASASVARTLQLPFVLSPRGMLLQWALQYKRARKRMAMALYQRRDLETAALFVATSVEEAEDLRKLALRQPIALIPNGVGLPADDADAKVARHDGDSRVALFLSRIHPKKGIHDLLAAWAHVRPPGWKLTIAGPVEDAGYKRRLDEMVREGGLETVCTFLGSIPDKDKWDVYRDADLFVLPSYSENFGIAVAEALACAVPVITTTGTPWQTLVAERCGWWIEPGAGALAAGLREATAMPRAALREMGERGRRHALRDFSWESVADKTIACYGWLLGARDRPACVID